MCHWLHQREYFDLYDREKMVAPVVPENDLDDVPAIIRNYKRNSTILRSHARTTRAY